MTESVLYSEHRGYLQARAVADDVIAERKVFSVPTKSALQNMGFGRGVPAPAMVMPLWDVFGACDGYQIRPDNPRVDQHGRVRKFEVPHKFSPRLDVHPRSHPLLPDPTIPIWITEGIPKGDALVSVGQAAVVLLGVWNWGGRSLADFEHLQPKGRLFYLCFDSDVMFKEQVHAALGRLGALLERRGGIVAYVYLPDDEQGRKQGVDDYLAAGGTIDELLASYVTTELRTPAWDRPADPPTVDTFDDIAEEDGVKLLDSLVVFITRFVWFPNEHMAVAVALWVVHTYLLDRFDFSPRLHIKSPAKRSGKSRLLEVTEQLANQARYVVNISTSALFRLVEKSRPSLLVDEVDRLFGEDLDQDRSDLVGLLNAGFRRGATVARTVGQGADMDVREFSTFAPVALAGIGTIPDTIEDRSVIVRLERRPPGQPVEPFRLRLVDPEGKAMRRRVAAWCHRHGDTLGDAWPEVPAELNDRAADLWAPLLAIADEAGGEWPSQARAVAVALSALHDVEDARESEPLRLLRDVYESWPEQMDRRFTAEIIKTLNELEGAPWADMANSRGVSAGWLAKRLGPFGAEPTKIRIGSEVKRGYLHDDLVVAWERYGITEPATRAHASTLTPPDAVQASQPEHPWSDGVSEPPGSNGDDPAAPASSRHVPDRTDVPPSGGREREGARVRTPGCSHSLTSRSPDGTIRCSYCGLDLYDDEEF